MTIHVTWLGVLALIGAGALAIFIVRILWGLITLILFNRGMK